eukprot:2822140-Rhodomonas_salina.2
MTARIQFPESGLKIRGSDCQISGSALKRFQGTVPDFSFQISALKSQSVQISGSDLEPCLRCGRICESRTHAPARDWPRVAAYTSSVPRIA